MWERMSYYGMRALLTLYMVDYLFIKHKSGDSWAMRRYEARSSPYSGPCRCSNLARRSTASTRALFS
jgi:hypothetical protein